MSEWSRLQAKRDAGLTYLAFAVVILLIVLLSVVSGSELMGFFALGGIAIDIALVSLGMRCLRQAKEITARSF